MFVLYRLQDNASYFPEIKEVTWL